MLKINADISKRVVVLPEEYNWVPSPAAGVERMMLDRVGGEVARATSIVRYAPNSSFPTHTHDGGEEFLVLQGCFADEHGQYPVGSYIRNPIGTHHTPRVGPEGATIFVKLWQFLKDDSEQKVIFTNQRQWRPGLSPKLEVMPLHDFQGEHVALVKWEPNAEFNEHAHWGGEEIFVLEGTLYDEYGAYSAGSWLRNPHLSRHRPYTLDDGALIYVKVGHLNGEEVISTM